MEATLYFLVKIACAIFILWHLWLFIFGQKMYEIWDRLYHHMRIVRIRLWKYRKKRMAEKIRSASRKTRHGKKQSRKPLSDTVGPGTKMESSSPAKDDDVIGKTKIVYLEDPEVARKTPTRSEPMKKEPIEEDEDINPDDVIDDFTPKKGLTESEKRELMSNDGCVPDPDFSRALTFEELDNVADVLISGTDDRKKIRNAAETLYQLQDTDLFRFFSTELSTQSQLEKLLRENMPNGKETSKQSLEQIGIDWNKYM